ncbi:amidohydrolase [Pseudoflavonifractor phocaeensis]|uniref:amidohydrolase n=1 Tax=Pseudoflavonifractor phocaeensis TaxID=1870988 RepID=UPI00195EAD9E|nr:amidohydrolase [Pseudoflavonifractor phocaeensis]MBM6937925.1 amidohydrolase [Pseudoflavonifractor phocaeensis]
MNDAHFRIFYHCDIFTADDARPYADCMILKDGVIQWVGPRREMPPVEGEAVDLKGRRVIPGFVDAHMHPVMLADFRKQITAMPPEICSIEDLVQAIRNRRAVQQPGQWIEGWGYDEHSFAEQRPLTRYDLDRGCSDAPVSILRTCAHIRCVNSMALRLAGIDRNTPDPQGGEIERDETGEPTGVLKENARNLIAPLLPVLDEEAQVDNLVELGKVLSAQGVTAVCDMGTLDGKDCFPIYEKAAAKGFRQQAGLYYMWDFFSQAPGFVWDGARAQRDRQIFTAGLKLISDGSVSGRTAWMDAPYEGSEEAYGISVCDDRLLDSAVSFCKAHGCQLSLHAMGARAIARMVDRVCGETPWTPAGIPYVRIEHATKPSRDSVEKAAAKGIPFVTQPVFLYAESKSYVDNLGPERTRQCYPIRQWRKAGVPVAFSTDAPATFWATPSDPIPGLKLAVTRRAYDGTDCGLDEAVDMETAIRLYTREAAAAAGFPRRGVLAPGYFGDFLVLSGDILTADPETLEQIRVEETYINGDRVYQRAEAAQK